MRFYTWTILFIAVICTGCSRNSNHIEHSLNDSASTEPVMDSLADQTMDSSDYVVAIYDLTSFCDKLDSNDNWNRIDTVEGVDGVASSEGNMAIRHVYDSLTQYSLYVFGCGGRREYNLYAIQHQLVLMHYEDIVYDHPIAQLTDGDQRNEIERLETHDEYVDYYFQKDSIVFRNSEVNESGFKGLIYSEVVALALDNLEKLNAAFEVEGPTNN